MLRLLICLHLLTKVVSFHIHTPVISSIIKRNDVNLYRNTKVSYLSESDKDEPSVDEVEKEDIPVTTNELQQQQSIVVEEESKSYPIDAPSPILLASSMILAIASIGSIFELTSGTPKLGFGITAVIALLGFPTFIYLFYAAILKGAAETEEDDKAFLKNDRMY